MTTAQKKECGIFRIFSEILLDVLAPFLRKREQNRFFSSCKAWSRILRDVRTFSLNEYHFNKFCTDLVFRQKLLKLVGYTGEDDEVVLRRKLKFCHISYIRDEYAPMLLKYERYFYKLDESINMTMINKYPEWNKYWKAPDNKITIILAYKDLYKLQYLRINDHNEAENLDEVLNHEAHHAEGFLLTSLRGIKSINISMKSEGYDSAPEDYKPYCELELQYQAHLEKVSLLYCANLFEVSMCYGVPEVLLRLCSNVENIDGLAACRKVTIDYNEVLYDISALQNVPEVYLESLSILENVEPLAYARKVELRAMPIIQDISCLGHVQDLYVTLCAKLAKLPTAKGKFQSWRFYNLNLRDVSSLKDVYRLSLSFMQSVTDTSMLGHVQYLEIDGWWNLQHYPKPLGKNQEWSLGFAGESYSIKDLNGFESLHRLSISCNSDIVDVSPLKDVHTIELTGLHNVTDLSPLANAKFLTLDRVHNVTDVQCLQNVEELTIICCMGLTKLEGMINCLGNGRPADPSKPKNEFSWSNVW